MKASSLIILLFVLATPAVAQKATHKDFKDYCKLNEGRWIGDVTWVADWPGFGKKGDKVTAYFEATLAEDGNAMTLRFFGGEGSSTGLCFFDAEAKQIRLIWVNSSGATSQGCAYKQNGNWIETGSGSLADGTKTEMTSTLTVTDDGNTQTCKGTGTVGGEKTDDQHDVWHRVSK